MKGLTDIEGIRVGHATDLEALTGCTVVLCEQGAVAGCDIRGGASGTEEFEVMSPLHIASHVHGVVFAGGSAFGLEAASGVRRFLEQKGVGFQTAAARVPIVPCAILYDLGIGKAGVRPTREMGEAAAAAANSGPVKEGCVGAGTGATVGKAYGMLRAMKGGVGSFTVDLGGKNAGVLVSALAAVNAFGDVIDPRTGSVVAGARRSPESHEFSSSAQAVKHGLHAGAFDSSRNTTLVVVATNAALNKVQATRLAQAAQVGLTRTISPANTGADGDLVIGLSIGNRRVALDSVSVAAVEAVQEAILRAVRAAVSLGGVPSLS